MTLDQLETLLKALSPQGFSLPQLRTLLSLRSQKKTMSDIAGDVGHSTAAATGSVDIMEKRGLVERSFDASDRRCVFVSLTKEGHASLASIEQRINHSVN